MHVACYSTRLDRAVRWHAKVDLWQDNWVRRGNDGNYDTLHMRAGGRFHVESSALRLDWPAYPVNATANEFSSWLVLYNAADLESLDSIGP